ncbi:protein terminal ear1 homolog [Actinidia eriantha]|uniref:protein terminal ear1 homolog n=1 Tax=Actinidia eriantha TaxID=165200 RepID=UPI0025881C9E|nr:protein terminal ear1 homolog [Actinidia eriantha]
MCKTTIMISANTSKQLNPYANEWRPVSPYIYNNPPPPVWWPPVISGFQFPQQIYQKQRNRAFTPYFIPCCFPIPEQSVSCYNTQHQPQPQSVHYPQAQGPLLPSAAAAGHGGGSVVAKTTLSVNKRSPRRLRKSDSRCEWVPKKKDLSKSSVNYGDVGDHCVHHLSPLPESGGSVCGRTTVMIRNIPNQYRRHMLLGFLDKLCEVQNHKADQEPHQLRFEYDFVYLPMDFGSGDNLGYAFVNFTSAIAATRIRKLLFRYKWGVFEDSNGGRCHSNKICETTWARIQGKVELVKHFRSSLFVCSQVEYLPVVLSPPRDGGVPASSPTAIGRYSPRMKS